MAYLGNDLQVAFPSYRNIDDISGSFNGVTTSFPLTVDGVAPIPAPINSQQCLISVNGVVQRPDDSGTEGFRLSGGNIIFASAPAGGVDFFGVILAGADYVNVGANFPSGSAAAPSITFDSDLDTGIYNPAGNQIGFSTAGTQRLVINSSGQISSGLGTAAAPAFSFISDPNTGIYSPGADQLALSTNGTGRLFVDASGNVGVGTTTPSSFVAGGQQLVVGSGTGSQGITIYAGASNASALYFADGTTGTATYRGTVGYEHSTDAIFFSTAAAERARIDSSGRLGIGTSTARAGLTVALGSASIPAAGASTGSAVFSNGSDSGVYGLVVGANTSGLGYIQSQRTDGTATTYDLAIQPNGGRVGIGTTSPSQLLHTSRTTDGVHALFFTEDGTRNPRLAIYTDSSGSHIQHTYSSTAGNLIFDLGGNPGSGTEKMRIDSSGRLLVGTSSAVADASTVSRSLQILGTTASTAGQFIARFDNGVNAPSLVLGKSRGATVGTYTVVNSGDQIGRLVFDATDGTKFVNAALIAAEVDGTPGADDMPGRLVFSTTADGASTPTERMRIANDGESSIYGQDSVLNCRTASTSSTADVLMVRNGASSTTTGTIRFSVKGDGDCENTNNSYGALSDIKLKENIADANSQWSDIKALQVRKYNFKPETGHSTHTQIGLIAQEVELVSPGLVGETPDRDSEGNDLGTVTKSVNYSVLYMKAVKALQEAMERIETLEASNADLLARVSALESA